MVSRDLILQPSHPNKMYLSTKLSREKYKLPRPVLSVIFPNKNIWRLQALGNQINGIHKL